MTLKVKNEHIFPNLWKELPNSNMRDSFWAEILLRHGTIAIDCSVLFLFPH